MKKYCLDLQGGLWFQYNTKDAAWYAKPCCYYGDKFLVTENINTEYWQHPKILAERQNNLDGQELSDLCKPCKIAEDNGNISRRLSWNDRFGTSRQSSDSVVLLDVMCDFSCNLACLICGPKFSTKWRQVDPLYKLQEQKFKVRATHKNVLELLDTIPTHNLKQIHYQGGEPFLSNTHVEILKKLQNKVDLSQITLWYHSNGTKQVSYEVLKLWEKLKMVEIYFSIDDMGPRMEYQRWPMQWNEVHANLIWFRENLPHNTLLRIERTIGILSAYWADDLENWQKEYFSKTKHNDVISMNYHKCFDQYSLQHVSDLYKEAVLDKFSPGHWVHKTFKNLQKPANQPAMIHSLFADMDRHDQLRNQNWKSVYPEFLQWYPSYAN